MATTYITRDIASAGNFDKWTFSCWIKRSSVNEDAQLLQQGSSSSNYDQLRIKSGGALQFEHSPGGVVNGDYKTSKLYRDVGAWYHIVFVWDSGNATAADRMIAYTNGVRETNLSTYSAPTLNQDSIINDLGSDRPMVIGAASYDGGSNHTQNFNGVMSHVQFVDGQALAPTEFGEFDSTSGIWKIKTSCYATPGTNGFCLKMEDRTNLDLDSSSNAHTFTTGGTLTATYDNPSNNFATFNPIARTPADTGSLTNGNTTYSLSNYSYNGRSTLAMATGKWYWEYKTTTGVDTRVGICTSGFNPNLDTDATTAYWGSTGNGGIHVLNTSSGTSWNRTNNDTSQNRDTLTSALASGAGSIISIALDVDAGKMWCAVNGVWFNSGDPAAGTNDIMTLTNSSPDPYQVFLGFNSSSSYTADVNFGNGYFGTTAVSSTNADDAGIGSFEYDVPTGYYALCTKNIKTYG